MSVSRASSKRRPWAYARNEKDLVLPFRAFIESRLDDHGLDPSTIAAGQHSSVRYLRKLVEEEDQAAIGWIRDQWIEHCRRDWANAALADTPVRPTAARSGLANSAHFSRLFKARFSPAPGQYRVQALNCGSKPVADSASPDTLSGNQGLSPLRGGG
jgi:AraC-like DNA-binding protein